jgi:hypothetical protein
MDLKTREDLKRYSASELVDMFLNLQEKISDLQCEIYDLNEQISNLE